MGLDAPSESFGRPSCAKSIHGRWPVFEDGPLDGCDRDISPDHLQAGVAEQLLKLECIA